MTKFALIAAGFRFISSMLNLHTTGESSQRSGDTGMVSLYLHFTTSRKLLLVMTSLLCNALIKL
jgi:hypothetical protein